MELSPELLFVIGIASSVIVFILKKVFVSQGKEVPNWVYTIGVYVVSFALSLLFAPIVLPPFDPGKDAAEFMTNLVAYLILILPTLSAFVGFATLVYNALKNLIFEKMAKLVSKGFKKLVSTGSDSA